MKEVASPKELPIVKGHWLFKNALEMRDGVIQFVEKYNKQLGDVFYVNTLREEIAIINHPDYAKHVFQDYNKKYKKSFGYEVLRLFLGNGLLTSEGDFWLKQRRLVQPAFHRERLQKLAEEMISATDDYLKKVEQYHQKGVEFNIAHDFSTLALDIVSRALFTSDVAKDMETITTGMDVANEFAIKKIFQLIPLPMWVPTKSHVDFQKAESGLDKVIMDIIHNRRKSSQQHHDLLAMLMETQDEETGEKMSDRQIRDEAMTIFLAGHETTAVALSWIFYLLSEHPEAEQKIRAEVAEVCGENPIAPAHIHQLKYTRMVIDECLRFYPPAWILGRSAMEDDVIGGCKIPKGTNVMVLTYHIHRLPEFWENPDEFKPERFSPEKVKEMHKFAYFPFGGGPRQCVGNNFALMEMQVILASLLRKYTFVRTSNEVPEKEQLVTLRMKNGLNVKAVAV